MESLLGEAAVVANQGLRVTCVCLGDQPEPEDARLAQGVACDMESSSSKYRQTSLQSKCDITIAGESCLVLTKRWHDLKTG